MHLRGRGSGYDGYYDPDAYMTEDRSRYLETRGKRIAWSPSPAHGLAALPHVAASSDDITARTALLNLGEPAAGPFVLGAAPT